MGYRNWISRNPDVLRKTPVVAEPTGPRAVDDTSERLKAGDL
jgi:hypothetical protein